MDDRAGKLLGLCVANSIITVAFIARLVLILTIRKTELIIQRHYSGYKTTVIATVIATLIMIASTTYVFLKFRKIIRTMREKTSVKSNKTVKSRKTTERLDTPEEVYSYLKNRTELGKPYASVFERQTYERILSQLDEMNELQERLERLLELNNSATSLNETRDLLQDIENAICLGVRKAINLQIAGGEDILLGRIENILSENRKLLREAEGILIDIAEFINGGEGDISLISQRIQDYRQTIQDFLKEENDDDGEEDNCGDSGNDTGSVARGM